MEALISRLADAKIGDTFNFYRDGDGAEKRRARLLDYLRSRERAPLLLVGEAAGYRGARVSGLPFTSERQLTGAGPAEASATIVHRVLAEHGRTVVPVGRLAQAVLGGRYVRHPAHGGAVAFRAGLLRFRAGAHQRAVFL